MTINLTPTAAEHVARVAGNGANVRLSLHRGGCAGAKYRLSPEAAQAGDIAQACEGFTLHIAAVDAELLDGTVIDCVDGLGGRHITFNNPRETARCGCGQSIALRA